MLYEAIRASLTTSHLNSPFEVWDEFGYMPENLQTQSVSITLELAYDDWCAAQVAKYLGLAEDYDYFMRRSEYWRNLYNDESGFFQSKNSDGEWITPFDPYKYGANGGYPFTEGNAWQYLWYVPQNVDGLIETIGGSKVFCKRLDEFFTSKRTSGEKNDNASGFVGLYVHGNEPVLYVDARGYGHGNARGYEAIPRGHVHGNGCGCARGYAGGKWYPSPEGPLPQS